MGQFVALRHEEGVRLDGARLVSLVTELGDCAAESVVSRTMEEMALQLSEMERHYREGETRVICQGAQRLSRLAAEVGMTTISQVSRDVHTCASRSDMVAFGATWARLLRIADRSLSAIWDLQGSTTG